MQKLTNIRYPLHTIPLPTREKDIEALQLRGLNKQYHTFIDKGYKLE